jgi:hypothetical protein
MPETPNAPEIDLKQLLKLRFGAEKRDSDEESISRLTGRCKYDGTEGVKRDLKQINADQQKSMAAKIAATLGKEPTSWEDQLEWHSRAAVLSVLDPAKHAEFNKTISANVKIALAMIEKSDFKEDDEVAARLNALSKKTNLKKDLTDPLTQLDARLVKLYELMGVQTLPECRQLCIEQFSAWEQQMNEKNTKDIPSFLRKQVEIAKGKEKDWLRPIMKDAMKRTLDRFADNGEYPKVRAKLEEKNGEYFYVSKNSDGKTRTWKVEIYSEGGALLYFRSQDKAESGLVFAINMMDGLDGLENDPQQIDKKADEAVATYQKEHGKEQQDTLNNYDLPKDRKIAHIRLFPQTYDGIVSKGLQSSMLLSTALKTRYKEAFIGRPPLFSDEPEKALRQEIQDVLKANGGKAAHFCIDVFSHGSKDHFVFEKQLQAKDVVQIAKDFPQCTFTYNTIACYGAGMMKGTLENTDFATDKGLQSRLAVFTQSKGDIPNLPAYSTAVTMYYVHLMQALNDGKSYGEAHRIADIEVKKYLPVDAEAIIDGKKLVMDKPVRLDDALPA